MIDIWKLGIASGLSLAPTSTFTWRGELDVVVSKALSPLLNSTVQLCTLDGVDQCFI